MCLLLSAYLSAVGFLPLMSFPTVYQGKRSEERLHAQSPGTGDIRSSEPTGATHACGLQRQNIHSAPITMFVPPMEWKSLQGTLYPRDKPLSFSVRDQTWGLDWKSHPKSELDLFLIKGWSNLHECRPGGCVLPDLDRGISELLDSLSDAPIHNVP